VRRALQARRSEEQDETGATAILVALLALVIFACAALAVDISSLAMERQRLHDHVDSAAHAGAFELPASGTSAKTWAVTMAKSQDAGMTPDTELFCVVASTGAGRQVASGQIPATCDPGTYSTSQVRCNTKICSIPCPVTARCNTIRVTDSKDVDFDFAPVIGHDQGSTGSVSSSACRGACGETLPNPMDIVFMADRTTSMADDDREDMQAAIVDSLGVMDPTLHYVAFGAMHKSKATSTCATAATTASDGAKGGKWIAIDFANDYKANRDAPISSSSKLVRGVKCMPNGAVPGLSTGSYGTHLASAFKGASRYLLGLDPNNLASLPKRPGTAKKVLIFETDGQPDELLEEGSTSITSSGDIGAGRNTYGNGKGKKGCDNLTTVAEQAKARGVTVLVIGFGDARSASCEKPGGRTPRSPWVRDYLAAAASPTPSGTPSRADSDCSTSAERVAENKDGDYFYCAASGTELGPIFATAVNAVTESIKLIRMP
jgi:Flp pilus assembly protein TadG